MTVASTNDTWCTSLCRTLDALRESSAFSDVIIHAVDGPILRAHKCVLAASSPVLKTQLMRSQHYLDLPSISRRMWQVLLHFVYTGTLEVQDVAEIPGVVAIGILLQFKELLSACEGLSKGSTQQVKSSHEEEGFKDDEISVITQEETCKKGCNPEMVKMQADKLNPVTDMSIGHQQVEAPNTSTDEQEEVRTETLKTDTPLKKESEQHSRDQMFIDYMSLAAASVCEDTDGVTPAVKDVSPLSCHVCGKTFRRLSSLKHHMDQHTGEQSHVCGDCGSRFSQRSSLNRHKKLHTGVKPYACSACDMTFFRASHLVTHERHVHSVEKPHKCRRCDEAFATRSELVVHEQVHVEEDKSPSFPCQECNKTFTSLSNLERHELAHSGDRPFVCADCAMTFRHRSNLWRHRCTDHAHKPTGGMPFQCSICDKNFRLKSSLARHEEIHNGVRRHLCVVCGKRFTSQLNLAAHSRTHLDKRPYQCLMCDKAFNDGSNLRRHKLTHSDEKPFLCAGCGKGFYRKVDMTDHYRRKHSVEKPYKCVTCGDGFNCRRNLTKHACYKRARSNVDEHLGNVDNSDIGGGGTNGHAIVEQRVELPSRSVNTEKVEMLDLVDVLEAADGIFGKHAVQKIEQSSTPARVNTVQIVRLIV